MFLKISKNSQENKCARVKETLAQVFSCEFCKILRTPLLQKIPGRLFLKITIHILKTKFTNGTDFFQKTCS